MLFTRNEPVLWKGMGAYQFTKDTFLSFVSPATSSRTWKGQVDSNFQCFEKYSFVQYSDKMEKQLEGIFQNMPRFELTWYVQKLWSLGNS